MRRKGVPCACDPCKGKNYVRAVNNVSPDPNGDLNIIAGAGINIHQSGDDSITIINSASPHSFVAGDNIEINPSGNDLEIRVKDDISVDNVNVAQDAVIGGDLTVNGTYYTVHAEHVYTEDDYIIMRDGAVTGLGSGDYSGFEIKKYDGTNDGRLVIDKDGVARVGDVGDEQPLLTREEAANLINGALLKWDSANSKAVDEGSVGDDTHPVKSVNGVLTPVSNALQTQLTTSNVLSASRDTGNTSDGNIRYSTYGKLVVGNFDLKISNSSTWTSFIIGYGLPNAVLCDLVQFACDTTPGSQGWCSVNTSGQLILSVRGTAFNGQNIRGTFIYIAQ